MHLCRSQQLPSGSILKKSTPESNPQKLSYFPTFLIHQADFPWRPEPSITRKGCLKKQRQHFLHGPALSNSFLLRTLQLFAPFSGRGCQSTSNDFHTTDMRPRTVETWYGSVHGGASKSISRPLEKQLEAHWTPLMPNSFVPCDNHVLIGAYGLHPVSRFKAQACGEHCLSNSTADLFCVKPFFTS